MPAPAPIPVPHVALPFILVHGAWLWLVPLAVAAPVGAAAAVWRLRRGLGARAAARVTEARAAAVAFDAPEAAPGDGAEVAVEGRLVARAGGSASGAASVWFFGRTGGRAGTLRTRPDLAVEIDGRGGRDAQQRRIVELDGPVQVVAGARAEVRRGQRAPETGDLAEEVTRLRESEPWLCEAHNALPIRRTEIHRIPLGSRVLAVGRLHRAAAREHTGGYRTQADSWRLSGAEDAPILFACARTRPASWRHSRWLRGACLGLIFGFGLLWGAGHELCDHGDYRGDGPIVLRDGDPLVIASALPLARHRALEAIDGDLQLHASNSARAAAEEAAFAHLFRTCDAEAGVWLRHFHPARAARVADACGDRKAAARAYAELGDYRTAAARLAALVGEGSGDEAVAALTGGEEWNVHDRLATLIAGHRFVVAARVARALGDAAARRRIPPGPVQKRLDAQRRLHAHIYRCLALALRAHGGDAGDAARLGAIARRADGWICGALYADLLAGQDLDRYVAAWSPPQVADTDPRWFAETVVGRALTFRSMVAGSAVAGPARFEAGFQDDTLAWISGYLQQEPLLLDMDAMWLRLSPGVAASFEHNPRVAVAPIRPGDTSAAAFVGALSVFRDAVDDPARAAARLDEVSDPHTRRRLAAFIAFERGRTDGPRPDSLDGRYAPSWAIFMLIRRGRIPAAAHIERRWPEMLLRSWSELLFPCVGLDSSRGVTRRAGANAIRRAVAGDGRPLAALLRRCRNVPDRLGGLLQALAPRIHRGGRRLAAIEAWGEPDAPSIELRPCARAVRAHARRDIFKWLGDRVDRARWDAIYRRQERACSAPDTATALWTARDIPTL